MTKYLFSVDGISVVIYPVCEPWGIKTAPIFDGEEGAIKVALLSDSEADFRIECFDKNNFRPREPHLVLAALSCFFSRVRGYPDMSLEIAYRDKVTKLALDKYNGYKFSVNGGKCKNICAKTVDFLDGVTVRCDILQTPDICALLLCDDVDHYSIERLRLLYDRLGSSGVKSLAALSDGDKLRIRTVGDIYPYEAVRIALGELPLRTPDAQLGVSEALVDGAPCKFSLSNRGITFYPEIKYIS